MGHSFLKGFERHVAHEIRRNKLKGSSLLVGLSGGRDSVSLLIALHHIQNLWGFKLAAVHVHHGVDSQWGESRDKARSFCETLCEALGVPLYIFQLEGVAANEAHWRMERQKCFDRLVKEKSFDKVVLAHHQEDLVETRLIRLLRGVGEQGLASMKVCDQRYFRPLLGLPKREVEKYSDAFVWAEDPSNGSDEYLRNWIRHNWLKTLKRDHPELLAPLHKSMETLSQKSECYDSTLVITKDGLSRSALLELPRNTQKQIVARYMRELGLKNYTQNHINEVLKRLDSPRKEMSFRLLDQDWEVNASHICLGRS